MLSSTLSPWGPEWDRLHLGHDGVCIARFAEVLEICLLARRAHPEQSNIMNHEVWNWNQVNGKCCH